MLEMRQWITPKCRRVEVGNSEEVKEIREAYASESRGGATQVDMGRGVGLGKG